MNQISMNALSNGWSLGFGTSVPSQDTDFDLLVAHKSAAPSPDAQSAHIEAFAEFTSRAQEFFASFVRYFAH